MRKPATLLLAALALAWSSATVAAPDLDAYLLAIQHFDPGHERGLSLGGDETAFMGQVLAAARRAVPAVAFLHLPVDDSVHAALGPSAHGTLRLAAPGGGTARSEAAIGTLRDLGESLGRDCLGEEQVNRRRLANGQESVTRLVEWDLGRGRPAEADPAPCAAPDLVRWLRSLGVVAVVYREHEYKHLRSADLYLKYGGVVDLEFCARRLAADPRWAAVSGGLVPDPYYGSLVGDGPGLRVVPTAGLTGYDGVRVEFSYGWGDCPAGCIHRHYWLFEYRTGGARTDAGWPLAGGLVEQYGDPLPPR